MRVNKLTPEQWDVISADAHVAVFQELRPSLMNRIDYAMVVVNGPKICGFTTVRELDHESVYWQFGGILPDIRKSSFSIRSYFAIAEWSFGEGVKNISTIVENTNTVMLKMALRIGFVIIGTKTLGGKIYVDLHLKQEDYVGLKRNKQG